jgi:acetyl-CoA/propionyl-CoA carboxylase biotin carboxyl carrier protein
MRRLGDKIGARRLAAACGVPVSPGYDGDDQGAGRLADEAGRLGYPLLVKASAGGGGRGMRRVDERGQFAAALEAAQAEAQQAFGDGRVFLERLIEPARHVEVQLLADAHGAVRAVGDRDCSLQRRHQKVVEEAPAPDLEAPLRAEMHAAAERLAAAAGYTGAGTAEFLVSGGRAFFLELNARLQVEHTVTEMVTGLDLVEWQLRVAAGEPLALPAAALRPTGHAIQARIYAEEPARGFLPASGRVAALRWPAGAGIRVDAAVTAAGQAIPAAYDPLIGKVIAWSESRAGALARLDAALAATVVLGVPSNTAYLRRVLRHPDVRRGPVTTTFLGAHDDLLAEAPPPPAVAAAVGAAALAGPAPWRALAGWRAGGHRPLRLRWEDQVLAVAAPAADPAVYVGPTVLADGTRGWEAAHEGGRWVLESTAPVAPSPEHFRDATAARGVPASAAVQPRGAGHWLVAAPLAGRLARFAVGPGTRVAAGAPLATIEAMKMQHAVTSPRAGSVVRLLVTPGAVVRARQPLVEMAP